MSNILRVRFLEGILDGTGKKTEPSKIACEQKLVVGRALAPMLTMSLDAYPRIPMHISHIGLRHCGLSYDLNNTPLPSG
jgi:hypothetical protein